MKDLFLQEIEDIEFEKSAESQALFLNRDATQWVKEITTLFLQRFPYLQEEPIAISWTKKDPDKGYAVGALKVLQNGVVPLIIKEWRLSPMDVLILPEVTIPLNDYFLKKLYHTPEIFSGLADANTKSTEQLFGGENYLQFSPTGEYGGGGNGVHVIRDAVKVASVIDNLSYINKEDAKTVLAHLEDEAIKRAFEKNGHEEIFEKIAQKAKLTTKQAHLDSYLRSLDIDRQMVFTDSKGNHFVKQANSRVNKTWTTPIDSLEAFETENLLANEKLAKKSEITKIAHSAEELDLKEGQIGKFVSEGFTSGEIQVTKIEKVAELPKFANFEELDSGKTLLITKEGNFAHLEEKKANQTANFEEFEGVKPRIGDFGVFITKSASTMPFEVTGMSKVTGEGNFEIKGEAGFDKVSFFPISMGSDKLAGFERHDKQPGAYFVPGDAKFIKLSAKDPKLAALKEFEAKIRVEGLNGFKKQSFYLTDADVEENGQEVEKNAFLLSDKELFFGKEAELVEFEKNASAVFNQHEVYRDGAGLYNFRGPQFAKYAQESPIRNLKTLDAKWSALHCGATEEDLEKIAKLGKDRTYVLEGEIKAPTALSELDKLAEKQASAADDNPKLPVWRDLVKVAANFRDKMSVDAVLSLSMLRKRNVEEYLNALPVLESALAELCKLLVASRLGMDHTDPDALKAAVQGLGDAVVQLHKLRAAATDIN